MKPQGSPVIAIVAASLTNGATNTAAIIDTNPSGNRARFLALSIYNATADVVSNKPSVLKLQHSHTTDVSNFADISGTIAGTDYTLPNANTSAAYMYQFNLDLIGKRRYIRALISPRTTQIIQAQGMLFWQNESPNSVAKAGVNALIEA
jgi:hypothetical protein